MPEPRQREYHALPPFAEVSDELSFVCDLCNKTFRGAPAGTGLLMWARGEEIRTEEPPLCRRCGNKLILRAMADCVDDEGEG